MQHLCGHHDCSDLLAPLVMALAAGQGCLTSHMRSQKEYQTLLPGDKCRQHTFVNHAWIFREAGTRRRMSVEDHGGQVTDPRPFSTSP